MTTMFSFSFHHKITLPMLHTYKDASPHISAKSYCYKRECCDHYRNSHGRPVCITNCRKLESSVLGMTLNGITFTPNFVKLSEIFQQLK